MAGGLSTLSTIPESAGASRKIGKIGAATVRERSAAPEPHPAPSRSRLQLMVAAPIPLAAAGNPRPLGKSAPSCAAPRDAPAGRGRSSNTRPSPAARRPRSSAALPRARPGRQVDVLRGDAPVRRDQPVALPRRILRRRRTGTSDASRTAPRSIETRNGRHTTSRPPPPGLRPTRPPAPPPTPPRTPRGSPGRSTPGPAPPRSAAHSHAARRARGRRPRPRRQPADQQRQHHQRPRTRRVAGNGVSGKYASASSPSHSTRNSVARRSASARPQPPYAQDQHRRPAARESVEDDLASRKVPFRRVDGAEQLRRRAHRAAEVRVEQHDQGEPRHDRRRGRRLPAPPRPSAARPSTNRNGAMPPR